MRASDWKELAEFLERAVHASPDGSRRCIYRELEMAASELFERSKDYETNKEVIQGEVGKEFGASPPPPADDFTDEMWRLAWNAWQTARSCSDEESATYAALKSFAPLISAPLREEIERLKTDLRNCTQALDDCNESRVKESKRVDAELAALRARDDEAVRLINAAFGEYACAASKVLPEDEQQTFEKNFAVPARQFLANRQTGG